MEINFRQEKVQKTLSFVNSKTSKLIKVKNILVFFTNNYNINNKNNSLKTLILIWEKLIYE